MRRGLAGGADLKQVLRPAAALAVHLTSKDSRAVGAEVQPVVELHAAIGMDQQRVFRAAWSDLDGRSRDEELDPDVTRRETWRRRWREVSDEVLVAVLVALHRPSPFPFPVRFWLIRSSRSACKLVRYSMPRRATMTNSRTYSDSEPYPNSRDLRDNSSLISSGRNVLTASVHLPSGCEAEVRAKTVADEREAALRWADERVADLIVRARRMAALEWALLARRIRQVR